MPARPRPLDHAARAAVTIEGSPFSQVQLRFHTRSHNERRFALQSDTSLASVHDQGSGAVGHRSVRWPVDPVPLVPAPISEHRQLIPKMMMTNIAIHLRRERSAR